MPHKCTKCEKIFKDGDICILIGCPNCGGKKFMYAPSSFIKNKEGKELSLKEVIKELSIKDVVIDTINKEGKELSIKDLIKDVMIDAKIQEKNKPDIKDVIIDEKIQEKNKPDIAGKRVESIRILEPGSYEININSILERDELVMAMKEEGNYKIDFSSIFKKRLKNKKRID